MPARRWPKRLHFRIKLPQVKKRALLFLMLFLLAVAIIVLGSVLRGMVTEYAESAARDQVVSEINGIVKTVMQELEAEGAELVNLERDSNGAVTAVTANVATINTLSAEVLSRAIEKTESETLTVKIPVANLLGSAVFMNHGPSVTVDVTMLSSSTAGFRSEITSAGINQTRHQLFLDLDVQLSFLLPWKGMDTSVQTEILISETVIVGKVPDSYMNWER